jgi:CBS domain-containing protein
MTANPTCCLPTDTVKHAAQLMRDANVGSIPVVGNLRTRRLIGIVTDRDLVLSVLAEGRNGLDVTIEQVMTRNPVTCRQYDDMRYALNIMSTHQVRRIPVVNENREVVGIIAQADIVTRIHQADKAVDVIEDISKPDVARRY